MKKIISLFIALLLLGGTFFIIPASANASSLTVSETDAAADTVPKFILFKSASDVLGITPLTLAKELSEITSANEKQLKEKFNLLLADSGLTLEEFLEKIQERILYYQNQYTKTSQSSSGRLMQKVLSGKKPIAQIKMMQTVQSAKEHPMLAYWAVRTIFHVRLNGFIAKFKPASPASPEQAS